MMECTVTVTCLFGPLLLTEEISPNVKPSVNNGRAGGERAMERLRKPINCVVQLLGIELLFTIPFAFH
jgi:hypothetical protein